jgi:hypothetical protein
MNGVIIASIDQVEHVRTRESIDAFVLAHVDQLEHMTADEARAEAALINGARAAELEGSVLYIRDITTDPALLDADAALYG